MLMSFPIKLSRIAKLSLAGAFSFLLASCSSSTTTTPPVLPQYTNTALSSDLAGIGKLDATMKNPWGLTFDATGSTIVVALNHSSSATYYDTLGNHPGGTIAIPTFTTASGGGAPSGVVQSSIFTIPNKGQSAFVFVGEDGVISAWGPALGSSPAVVAGPDRSAASVYKGVAVLGNYLYVANIKSSTIDIFDKNFKFVQPFFDVSAPSGYAPFNVTVIDGKLMATWTRPKKAAPDGGVDDSAGVGIGYVASYSQDATTGLLSSPVIFTMGGNLNSPWAIVKAPDSFGQYKNDILIGNFGDGKINVFDGVGKSLGTLNDATNAPIVIEGLWGLLASPTTSGKIYYTAGTNKEADGTLGYIQVKQ
jgi:uncharacterized protein (TIGR03118 family)